MRAGPSAEAEAEALFLGPLRVSWPATAELSAGLLYGYTKRALVRDEITGGSALQWREMAKWIIPEQPLSSHPRLGLNNDQEEALGLLVHVRHGSALLTAHWMKAPEFIDVYDQWVRIAGHSAWGFRTFLRFLQAGGKHLPTERVVKWLASAVERIAEPDHRKALWAERDTGDAAAQFLAGLWTSAEQKIRQDGPTLALFVGLLEELMRAGVPLAARTRERV